MSKVVEIGICENRGGKIKSVNYVEAIKKKGLVNDRKFKDNNDKRSQLTFIEIENINFYNKSSKTEILPVDFRRNIITKGVNLNNFLNKEFFVGNIKVKGHALCHPCKYLGNLLIQKNFVKELMFKAGLRCEILTSGKISVGDIIKTND